jgi:hypothetical protein
VPKAHLKNHTASLSVNQGLGAHRWGLSFERWEFSRYKCTNKVHLCFILVFYYNLHQNTAQSNYKPSDSPRARLTYWPRCISGPT